jgi:MFS family permease
VGAGAAARRLLGDTAAGVLGAVRWPEHRLRQVQRRTMTTLVATQGLGGLGVTIGITVAALLAEEISGSEQLAGLAQTMQVLGAALASYGLAHLMGIRGRRAGLVLGYVVGAVGAAVCVLAGAADSFLLLMVGTSLFGATPAANAQSRYAATDLAAPDRRARSLSLVVWATTIGAVAGPNLTGPAGTAARTLGLPPLTGPFLFGLVAIVLAAAVIWFFMRPDPLLVAREAALARGGVVRTGTAWRQVWQATRERPALAAGIAALALGHAVMVAVMVMTPLHMHHGGASLELIGVTISVHVLGMYFFSPLVGWAADRFGRAPVLAAGAGVLLLSLLLAGTSPAGASWRIGVGLFLLGVGWSLVTVAASTLLTEEAPLSVRPDVQGSADRVVGVVAAAAGARDGVVVGWLGFGALNLFAALLVTGVATAAEVARRTAGSAAPVDDEQPLSL